jgi:hypothetical protein
MTVKNAVSELFAQEPQTPDVVERIEMLGEYAEKRYKDEIDDGASPGEVVEAIKKDLPVAEEMIKIDQEIKKEMASGKPTVSDPVTRTRPHVVRILLR